MNRDGRQVRNNEPIRNQVLNNEPIRNQMMNNEPIRNQVVNNEPMRKISNRVQLISNPTVPYVPSNY